MQASQCAMSTNVDIRSTRTAAPYSEYLSIFLATRTRRSSRAVFNRPISVVVWKDMQIVLCVPSTSSSYIFWHTHTHSFCSLANHSQIVQFHLHLLHLRYSEGRAILLLATGWQIRYSNESVSQTSTRLFTTPTQMQILLRATMSSSSSSSFLRCSRRTLKFPLLLLLQDGRQ